MKTKIKNDLKSIFYIFYKKQLIPKRWKISAFFNAFQNLFANLGIGGSMKLIIDGLLVNNSLKLVIGFIILCVSSIYLIIGLPFLCYYLDTGVYKIRQNVTDLIFNKCMSVSSLESGHSSKYINILQEDVPSIMMLFDWNFVGMIQAIVSGFGSCIIILFLEWRLGLFSLCVGILLYFSHSLFRDHLRKNNEVIREKTSQRIEKTMDFLDYFILLRIYGQTHILITQISQLSNEKCSEEISMNIKLNISQILQSVITDIFLFSGILVIGSILISYEQLTFGSLLLIIQLVNGVAFLFGYIGFYINSIQKGLVAANHIESELRKLDSLNVQHKIESLLDGNEKLEMSDVTFSYPDNSSSVISNFSLTIKRNERVAILGINGSGKSTILKLLRGLYLPCKGIVSINGINTTLLSCKNMSKYVSMAPQETYIFEGSLKDNIALGKAVSNTLIDSVINASGLSEWIETLPSGLDTYLQENGNNISFGQIQRIGIARALVMDCPFLLLDEITSNIDFKNAQKIYKNIINLTKGKTGIVTVTHDLQIAQENDYIIYL